MTDPFGSATTSAADPFGDGAPTFDDPFDTVRATLPSMDWIVGRLVLIYPFKKLTGLVSKQPGGGDYEAVTADVHVLDGEPSDDLASIPCKIEDFRLAGDQYVRELERLIGTTRPKLARVGEAPSKANRKVMARFLVAPSEADKVTARAYMAKVGLI